MDVRWILEETDYQNDNNVAQRLMYMLSERGCPVTTFRYIPFQGTDYSFMPKSVDGPAVFFGTLNALEDMMSRVEDLPIPFAWCDFAKLKCTTYYKHLGELILQNNRWETTLEMLPLIIGEIYEDLGEDGCIFLRPDDNEKTFNGDIVKEGNFEGWLRGVKHRQVPESTRVIASRPQRIAAEWRFLLVDGKVVAGSQYKTNCCLDIDAHYDPAAALFAEYVAATWSPHPVFIVDIGAVGNQFKVVEVGPFNYAGLYKMNLEPVVDAINKVALRDFTRTRP